MIRCDTATLAPPYCRAPEFYPLNLGESPSTPLAYYGGCQLATLPLPFPPFSSHTQVASLLASCGGCQTGDLLLLAAGPKPVVLRSLDRVRQFLGRELGLIKAGQQSLLWVVDFPMFEFDEEEKR